MSIWPSFLESRSRVSNLIFYLIVRIDYYGKSAVPCPQRHYLNRFVRDMRVWTEKYIDYMHYTVPLTNSAVPGGYTFPGDYAG